jgi:hypothetical protein
MQSLYSVVVVIITGRVVAIHCVSSCRGACVSSSYRMCAEAVWWSKKGTLTQALLSVLVEGTESLATFTLSVLC